MKIHYLAVILVLAIHPTIVDQARAQEAGQKAKEKDKGPKVHEVGKGINLGSRLDEKDVKDKVRTEMFAKVFLVKLEKGKSYQIDMMSKAFDCYLRLENSKREQLAEDDDSGDGTDARIEFTPTEDGVYRIIATSFAEGEMGPFNLRIEEK